MTVSTGKPRSGVVLVVVVLAGAALLWAGTSAREANHGTRVEEARVTSVDGGYLVLSNGLQLPRASTQPPLEVGDCVRVESSQAALTRLTRIDCTD